MRAWLRSPRVWLLSQAAAVLLLAAASPDFETATNLDSRSYQSTLSPTSLEDTLQYTRTVGYPLFLRAILKLTGSYDLVAYGQLLLYLLAVIGFGIAAEMAWSSGWVGLAAATPLFYARVIRDHGASVMPDTLAAASAVATLASLLWLLARPGSRAAWAAAGCSLLLAYQARPAYLFLLALVPVLGLLLTLRRRGLVAWKSALRQPFLGLVLVAWLPFLLWSGLRWAVAGHFGLVSFGGINLIGITGSMLSPAVVRELPQRDRPLARAFLAGRREQGLKGHGRYHFDRWVGEYNINVWTVAFKATEKLYRRPDQTMRQFWVDSNRRFTRLSFAVLRVRPGLYRRWLSDAAKTAFIRIGGERLFRWALTGLALSSVLRLLWMAGARWRRPGSAGATEPRRCASLDLALVAGSYLAASLLLIIAVEPPVNRYIFAAALFVPSALLAAAVELWLPAPARA